MVEVTAGKVTNTAPIMAALFLLLTPSADTNSAADRAKNAMKIP